MSSAVNTPMRRPSWIWPWVRAPFWRNTGAFARAARCVTRPASRTAHIDARGIRFCLSATIRLNGPANTLKSMLSATPGRFLAPLGLYLEPGVQHQQVVDVDRGQVVVAVERGVEHGAQEVGAKEGISKVGPGGGAGDPEVRAFGSTSGL